MKYLEVAFSLTPDTEDRRALLTALGGMAGMDSFTDTESGLTGYAPENMLDTTLLDEQIAGFPFGDTKITYTVRQAEDRNWNEEWEKNGFTEVRIGDRICIHPSDRQPEGGPAEYDIRINPRQAFGTGTHQTTSMILAHLADAELNGKRVIDAGCGTGVLGIFCAMRGAGHVLGYDIDNWSVDNTKDNMALNGIDRMEVREGGVEVLAGETGYDLIIANINRNILLADAPQMIHALRPDGKVILSGFYEEDVPLLTEMADGLGLHLTYRTEKDGWVMLELSH